MFLTKKKALWETLNLSEINLDNYDYHAVYVTTVKTTGITVITMRENYVNNYFWWWRWYINREGCAVLIF
jgi:hypothetical protein